MLYVSASKSGTDPEAEKKFDLLLKGETENVPHLPCSVVRIFLSSTFTGAHLFFPLPFTYHFVCSLTFPACAVMGAEGPNTLVLMLFSFWKSNPMSLPGSLIMSEHSDVFRP